LVAVSRCRNANVLEVQLLGPLDVRDGERVLEVRRRKQRALLAVLALRAGEAVSADRLVEDIWGESPPKTARHALENYVSELRRTLGRDLIRTEPAGYVLDVSTEQVDALRLERALDRVDETLADRAARLREEVSRIRGQPLEDLAFEPFAQAAVPRLQELELSVREELAGLELELGRHGDVLLTLEALVASYPYREHLRALLMLALYRSGRQADALAAYQDARAVLVEELGIDPGEELQELERAILRQDVVLRAPPRVTARHAAITGSLPARPSRKTVTVLVARLSNAAELAERLEPELLRALLDRFAELVSAAAERHGGLASSEAGRARAVFGVPATHEDDALRAVRAAWEAREGVGALNDGLLPEQGVFLEVRTALDTGEVLVSPDAADMVTGRPVTSADELERSARPGQILLGAATYELVRGTVQAEPSEDGIQRLVEIRPDVHGRALRLDSPLVGRRRQLASLSTAFESVVAERALHLFTIVGVAGAGKSRLVREFLEGIDGVARVVRGQCLPYGDSVTFLPLADALHDTGPLPKEVTTTTVREAFERLTVERPLIVVVDDLHWAEPPLLDLLEAVAGEAREAPVLVVCTARPELYDERPSWGGGAVNASSVLLEPLSEAESERLVDNLLGESDLPDAVRDYIVDISGGNPLFVEELLATLVDRELLQREAGRWTTTQVPAIPLPSTIQALVTARIDRLPEPERIALELASVEGNVFSRAMVAVLAGGELGKELDVVLAALVRKELVRRQPADDVVYAFRHQLIRDAAYDSLPLMRRVELHDRLAEELGESSTESAELVIYHRERARRYRETLGTV
jgi:DNA-binding SARP family transcriptional activator